jgi:hypothetical protein
MHRHGSHHGVAPARWHRYKYGFDIPILVSGRQEASRGGGDRPGVRGPKCTNCLGSGPELAPSRKRIGALHFGAPQIQRSDVVFLERAMGLEPTTSCLGSMAG